MKTVGQNIGEFVANICRVGLGAPLEAFEKLTSLDGDALGEVFGRVELVPVALSHELGEDLLGFLAGHVVEFLQVL